MKDKNKIEFDMWERQVLAAATDHSDTAIMTPYNIRAGFRVTGIYPINPRAIAPEKFVTSSKCQELVKVQLYSVFNSLIH